MTAILSDDNLVTSVWNTLTSLNRSNPGDGARFAKTPGASRMLTNLNVPEGITAYPEPDATLEWLMDIFRTTRLQNDLVKPSYGSATALQIGPGQIVHLDNHSDLALVVAGQVCIERSGAPALTLTSPSLILRSEGEHATVRVLQGVTMLPLSYESCAALVAKQKSFRDLFFSAMTARIRIFHSDHAPLIPATPLALH